MVEGQFLKAVRHCVQQSQDQIVFLCGPYQVVVGLVFLLDLFVSVNLSIVLVYAELRHVDCD